MPYINGSITLNRTGLDRIIQASVEAKEKKEHARRKAFVMFIKEVLKHDKRYSIVPYEDSRDRTKIQWVPNSTRSGILGSVMLKREGAYADVVIHASEPRYGVIVNAGSSFSSGEVKAYPSSSMAWPIVAIANELERQFTREVEWDMNKHNQVVTKKKG